MDKMKFDFTAILVFLAAFANPQTLTDDCLACMCYVSSDGCVMPDPICSEDVEHGEICGPFAINRVYWMEAGWIGEEFHTCMEDWQCNEDTVRSYLSKFVLDANATCEEFSRTHVGGRHGPDMDSTLSYWLDVESCLDNSTFPIYPEDYLD
ncbi:lysozyme-like [Palaemon carinicauda]|uniref:lysozyme-like n=1 Tax=Palaemon carinicauda TaxID=392227 RepID=UPI0035B57133